METEWSSEASRNREGNLRVKVYRMRDGRKHIPEMGKAELRDAVPLWGL
jgi:hypothetical protein